MIQRTFKAVLSCVFSTPMRTDLSSRVGFAVALLVSTSAWAGPCDALSSLEQAAALGNLPPEVTACLLKARDSGDATRATQASSLLIANAFANQDDESWSRHVKTHLESVDNADCELMMKYGMHLLRTGAPENALRWIDAAAAHSFGWSAKVLEVLLPAILSFNF